MRTGAAVVTCCSVKFGFLCSGRPVCLAWVSATHCKALSSALCVGGPAEGEDDPNLEIQEAPAQVKKKSE